MEERFLEFLFTRCGYVAGEPVLVGVSGGMDSMALAHLMNKHKFPIALAHVNYKLRGEESNEDEEFVSNYAAQINLPFYLKRISEEDFAATGEPSTQAAARKIRYDW